MNAPPCRFFLAGNCRNGARCRFYHEGFSSLPASTLVETSDSDEDEETSISPGHRSESGTGATAASTSSASASTRPAYAASHACRWYMAGYCHRGESCWFSHDRGTVNAAYGGGQETIIFSDEEDEEDAGTQRRTSVTHGDSNDDDDGDDDDDDDDQKCAICFEVPKTFGLLISCNHAFCLNCIRTWRSKDISTDLQPHDSGNVSVTKACPNCRTPSLYVVPSSFFPTCSEQKEIIIQNYKEATARKPCKYFKDFGDRHWCPFGDDCHFAHLDENDEPCKVNPESNPRLSRQRRSNGGRAGYSRYPATFAQVRREVFEAMRGTSRSSHQDYEGLRTLLLQLSRLRTDMVSAQASSRDSAQRELAERDFDDDEPADDVRYIGGREWEFGRDNIYDDDDDDNEDIYRYGDEDSEDDEYYDSSWREDERHLTTVHRG